MSYTQTFYDRDTVVAAQGEQNEIEQLRDQIRALSEDVSIRRIELETLRDALAGPQEKPCD